MVYLQILWNLIVICAVFEPSKINYARGLISLILSTTSTRWAITQGFGWPSEAHLR
jgi:hypothetical protein